MGGLILVLKFRGCDVLIVMVVVIMMEFFFYCSETVALEFELVTIRRFRRRSILRLNELAE